MVFHWQIRIFHIEVPPMPESKIPIGWLSIKTKLSGID
jgi:hypothetical protein